MKIPDPKTSKMLENELNRLIEEVNADSPSIAEQNLTIALIMEITLNTIRVSAGVKRRAHEILYKFYSIIEGLEKK